MKLNAAFKKWFGDSKVSDDGHPLVVYHGSVNSGFTVFDPSSKAVRTRTGPAGVYFTSDARSAGNYIYDKQTKKRGYVFACYLSLQNPLDITKDILKFEKRGLSFGEAKRQALERLTDEHDGVVFWGNGWNPDEFIAFYPEQIKSVDNDGSWDLDDPDIRSNPEYSGPMNISDRMLEAIASYPTKNLESPTYCMGSCDSISVGFLNYAKTFGLKGILLAVDNPKRKPTGGWGIWGGDWRKTGAAISHYIAYFPKQKIGVDFSARQFWTDADVPIILKKSDILKEYDQLSFGWEDARDFEDFKYGPE